MESILGYEFFLGSMCFFIFFCTFVFLFWLVIFERYSFDKDGGCIILFLCLLPCFLFGSIYNACKLVKINYYPDLFMIEYEQDKEEHKQWMEKKNG